MKKRIKIAVFAAAMAATLNAPFVLAKDDAEAASSQQKEVEKRKFTLNSHFQNIDQQTAYVLGASFANYLMGIMENNRKSGLAMDNKTVLDGFTDTFNGKGKLSNEEIESSLAEFRARAEMAAKQKMAEEAKKGQLFIKKFAQEKGVKKTEGGLYYLMEKEGTGKSPTGTDVVVVNYRGTLIDGTEFDNTWTRSQPFTFSLSGVIEGWAEGIKLMKKGGKIKLVIPPEKAYGEREVPGIPANSTLIFDIELLDINPQPKAEAAQHSTNGNAVKGASEGTKSSKK